MKLTPEQEASLLEQYDCYIRSVVKEIRARGGYRNDFEEEDLMQEGRLAFLLHLRRMNSMDDILFCKRNILAAMWSYWRRMALVSIPHNKYKEEIRKVHRVNWRDAMIEIELREENRCETSALIQDFLSR